MNSTMLTPFGDPFADTLADLGSTLTKFSPLVKPIDAINTMLTDIDDMLKAVGDLIISFQGIDGLIELVGEALEFLSAIPIVGEIADLFASLIEGFATTFQDILTTAQQLDTDVIKPVINVLSDIVSGLGDARAVVVDLSQKVPGYINTIEILHYLSEIATPIVGVLTGTKPGQDLSAVLQTFQTVQQDVGKALAFFDPAILAVGTGITALMDVFNAITAAFGTAGRDALAAVEAAANALKPISDGFNNMVNAIAPLKWVLDALACIFNTILKPVIDLILEATGLKSLVDEAAQAVFQKLGIGPVLNSANTNLGNGQISAASAKLGPSQGAGTSSLWDATETALGQYRSGDSSATKTAILTVISAITQTPIDPTIPSRAPPFPPDLPNLAPAPSSTAALMSGALFVPRPVRRMNMRALARMQEAPTRHVAHSMLLAVPALTTALPKVDSKDWPNCAALIADIDILVAQLDQLSPEAAALEHALSGMDAALQLPASFGHQVTDMQDLLSDAVHILTVLDGFNVGFLKTIVKPFETVANDQNTKMGLVTAALPQLTLAISNLDIATKAIMAAFPNASLVETTLSRVEGWRMSLGQTVAMVRAARIKDAAKGNANTAQIDALATQIEASAAELHTRLKAISGHCTQIATAVAAAQGGITAFTGVLTGLTDHSQLLSDKALPAADQAVHVLGIVNSIMDPLSGLFDLTNAQTAGTVRAMQDGGGCIDGDSAFKMFGATAIAAIQDLATSNTNAPQTFEQFAVDLAEQAMPLTEMASFVNTAATSLSTNAVAVFQSQATALASSLQGLAAELVETKTYSCTIPTVSGKTQQITVQNDIVDGSMVTQAQALLTALGLASKQA